MVLPPSLQQYAIAAIGCPLTNASNVPHRRAPSAWLPWWGMVNKPYRALCYPRIAAKAVYGWCTGCVRKTPPVFAVKQGRFTLSAPSQPRCAPTVASATGATDPAVPLSPAPTSTRSRPNGAASGPAPAPPACANPTPPSWAGSKRTTAKVKDTRRAPVRAMENARFDPIGTDAAVCSKACFQYSMPLSFSRARLRGDTDSHHATWIMTGRASWLGPTATR